MGSPYSKGSFVEFCDSFHIEKDVRLRDISFSSTCMLRCFQGVVFYRGRVTQLEEELEKKERALEASIEEMKALRIQVEELDAKLVKAQAENRMLIDRWMEQKMKDAERLNEVNLCHLFFITWFLKVYVGFIGVVFTEALFCHLGVKLNSLLYYLGRQMQCMKI